MGKSSNKHELSDYFNIDGVQTNDPQIIADKFCTYFCNIGQEYADKIPKSHKTYDYYLEKNKRVFDNSFYMVPTGPGEIRKLINSLNPKNSTGDDGLSSNFIKKNKRINSIAIKYYI